MKPTTKLYRKVYNHNPLFWYKVTLNKYGIITKIQELRTFGKERRWKRLKFKNRHHNKVTWTY
jgi:hypothetical protein